MSEAVPCELIVVTDVVHPQQITTKKIIALMIARIEIQENIFPRMDVFGWSDIKPQFVVVTFGLHLLCRLI